MTSVSFQIENRKCTNNILIRQNENHLFFWFYVAEYVFEKLGFFFLKHIEPIIRIMKKYQSNLKISLLK